MDRYHRRSAVTPVIIFIVGIAAMIAGIWRGEALLVLTKAIRICLECVGIG